MSDLISRSALMEELARNSIVKIVVVGEKTVWDIVKDQPTIEAVEVVHGEIVFKNGVPHCSICGKVTHGASNYCQRCGADMRKGGAE
jgi:tRNA(Ile2) C34 agmatinyltransferase TiaS